MKASPNEVPQVLPKFESPEERLIRTKRERMSPSDYRDIIRSLHLKITQPRLLILQALQGGRIHVTAQEVHEQVLNRGANIGFATVYRFLRKLTETGHVTEVRVGGLPARYELTPKKHHDHLSCTHCGKIYEFANQKIEDLQLQVASDLGFKLTHHVLELYGICANCQKRLR